MRQYQNSNEVKCRLVRDSASGWMKKGYDVLNAYFGNRGEMESMEVIQERLQCNSANPLDGYSFSYEMVVFTDTMDNIVAAGDYTVILSHDALKNGQSAVVHLSHIWVDPKKPGGGIVRQLKELTVNATHLAIKKASLPADASITLVAEVEPYQEGNEEKIRRLKRFLHADLLIVDPTQIPYYQPDFRSGTEIDASGGAQPLLLTLMIRRINKELELEMPSNELKHIILCLYQMYGHGMRKKDMSVVYSNLAIHTANSFNIRLLKKL